MEEELQQQKISSPTGNNNNIVLQWANLMQNATQNILENMDNDNAPSSPSSSTGNNAGSINISSNDDFDADESFHTAVSSFHDTKTAWNAANLRRPMLQSDKHPESVVAFLSGVDSDNEEGQDKNDTDSSSPIDISAKLQRVFDLPSVEEYICEYPCWLVKNVLLQGRLFLTKFSICFYAHLDPHDDNEVMSGYLDKRTTIVKRKSFARYWFVLKDNTLSFYNSPDDTYFPNNTIDLKQVTSILISDSHESSFKIITPKKQFFIRADTKSSMQEWKIAIEKAVFRARNSGNSLKIVLPLLSLRDISLVRSSSIGDAIIVKVNDLYEANNFDEYFFACVSNAEQIFDSITGIANNLDESGLLSKSLDANEDLTTSDLTILRHLALRQKEKCCSRSNSISKSSPYDSLIKVFPGANIGEILNTCHAYLFIGPFSYSLPRFGKLILTTENVLFHSRLVGIRTKAVIPLSDIVDLKRIDKYLGFWHGIHLIMKNGSVWIEFRSLDAREQFIMKMLPRLCGGNLESVNDDHEQEFEEDHSADNNELVSRRRANTLSTLLDEIHRSDSKFSPPKPESWKSKQVENLVPIIKSESVEFPVLGLDGETLKISLFTIGSRGDVQPMIALGKGLKKHGHIVTIASHAEYKEWVEGHGLKFAPVHGNPAELMEFCVGKGLFTVSFVKEAYVTFQEWIDDLFASAYEALQGSDVIIESAVALAGYHIAQKLQVPYIACCTMPWTKTSEFSHPFAVSEYFGYGYNRMTWTLLETVMWKGLQPKYNKLRKEVLKIEPVAYGNWYEYEKIPFLYNFSHHVVRKPSDWGSWVQLPGYWFLDDPDLNWKPDESLLEFLDDKHGKPVIYIGFGSMVVSDPDELTRAVINAVKKANVRAVISKGWSARTQKDKKSSSSINDPDVYFLSSVPHDWLFPRMAAVVHHGGAGTTAAGLRYGVPTVIKPFFGDQYFWATRIVELGVGCWAKKLEVDSLADAIHKTVFDTQLRQRAMHLGERIRAENGVEAAIKIIHREIPRLRQQIAYKAEEKSDTRPSKSYTRRLRDSLWSSSSSKNHKRASTTSENDMIELENINTMTLKSMSFNPILIPSFNGVGSNTKSSGSRSEISISKLVIPTRSVEEREQSSVSAPVSPVLAQSLLAEASTSTVNNSDAVMNNLVNKDEGDEFEIISTVEVNEMNAKEDGKKQRKGGHRTTRSESNINSKPNGNSETCNKSSSETSRRSVISRLIWR